MEAAFISEKTVSGFSVVQFRTEGADTLEYISVGKAAETGKVKITEIDEGGRVGTILVQNDSDDSIFIAEGDLLQGAKQNRVVIASVFITPRLKFNLPVNCVEQGRWRHKSRGFTPHNQSAPTDLKRKLRNTVHNNIIMNRTHIADQMLTWSSVEEKSAYYHMRSGTNDLLEIMEEKRKRDEAELKDLINPGENANGLALFYAGELVQIENFNRGDIYAEYYRKIVLGAYDEYGMFSRKEFTPGKGELEYKTREMFDRIETWEKTLHKSIAAGEEKRFRDEVTSGFELIYDNKLVHLSLLRNAKN